MGKKVVTAHLRLPEALHEKFRLQAEHRMLSLNAYIVQALMAYDEAYDQGDDR